MRGCSISVVPISHDGAQRPALWFTEAFDTRDLKHAKVLLEELGG